MQYAILIYETDDDFEARTDPERAKDYIAPYETYVAALREAGVLVGLHALLLYVESRRAAGRDERGAYVPLAQQDPGDWDDERIASAREHLMRAAQKRWIGPFQLEAAIQSAVIEGRRTGTLDHGALLDLYAGLEHLSPTLGVRVGRAAAIAETGDPDQALALLDAFAAEAGDFQPFWAVRADVLRRLGRAREAASAYQRAIDLSQDRAAQQFLEGEQRTTAAPSRVDSRLC